MAKAAARKAVSVRVKDMKSGGLPDKFNGTIREVVYTPWDYDGKRDEHILAVRVTIDVDEDQDHIKEKEIVQHYSAGKLSEFVPSLDGNEPVDLEGDDMDEMAGHYAVPIGSKDELNNGSNWADFLTKLEEAGFEDNKYSDDGSLEFLEGVSGHFARVGQRERSGVSNPTGEGGQKRTILVMTEITGYPGGKKKRAVAAKTAKADKTPAPAAKSKKKAADEDTIDTLKDLITEVMVAAIEKAGEAVERVKLARLVLKKVGPDDKEAAMTIINDDAFYEEHEQLILDDDDDTVSLVEE